MTRPGVKICGVTRVEDALLAVELGAQLIGLNFWPRSPRFLTVSEARRIVVAISGRARIVGLWVDPQRQQLQAAVRELSLDLIQIHGQTSAAVVDWLPDRVIRALKIDAQGPLPSPTPGERVWGYLFDCAPVGVYGGTGVPWSYERIASLETGKPVMVAGGLHPGNVAHALKVSGADYADVCSGVESAPGIKEPELMRQFIREVQNVQTNH